MPRENYTIGVDLGQSSDPTAICVVRRVIIDDQPPRFEVPHLERLPLGTPYPSVIRHTRNLLSRSELWGAELVLDFTGVGRPVFDMFQAAGLSPVGVSITGGDAVRNEGLVWHVAKIVLVSRLQAVLHDGRLLIARSLPDAAVLAAELADFRAEVTDTGMWRFGARSGKHDDLVLALAIALWRSYQSEIAAGWVGFYRKMAVGHGVVPPLTEPPAPHPKAIIGAPPPPAPAAASVKMRTPHPWMNFHIDRTNYGSDEKCEMVVAQQHVEAIKKFGCEVIT